MDEFLTILRENAVYFKLTSKPKFGGAVSVKDVMRVLKSFSDSYNAFVLAEYDKVNDQIDKKRLSKILKGLTSENELMVVDLEFASYGMSVSPNTITHNHTIPRIRNQKEWKQSVFNSYKTIVLESDFNDQDYLENISKKYTPHQRTKIFKPLIDGIVKNETSKTLFRVNQKSDLKQISTPTVNNEKILIPVEEKNKELEIIPPTKSLAMVELKGKTAKPKVLELFSDVKNPIYSFNQITSSDFTAKLKFPIYCELINTEDGYIFENDELGIYSYGTTIDEAKKELFEEFRFIFDRYNSLDDSLLTDDVKNIRDHLNHLVEK
jgi:hypothetical protein